mgnify:CR=1 FL=1
MANKIGPLIKEARTEAGFTQEQLAKKIKGLSAADIIGKLLGGSSSGKNDLLGTLLDGAKDALSKK